MHFSHHALKRNAETEEHIRQAIRLDSNYLITFTSLARIHVARGVFVEELPV
jgi:hypothetical protein